MNIIAVALEAHIRAGARSELDADLAVCAHCLVAAENLGVAQLIIDAVQVANADVYELFGLPALNAHITSLVEPAGDARREATTGAFDLVEAAGRVIDVIRAG